jgi:hypothetical protein
MRHWERDLVDHLVWLMLLEADEPLKDALAELKVDFPSLPSEEAVGAYLFEPRSARRTTS